MIFNHKYLCYRPCRAYRDIDINFLVEDLRDSIAASNTEFPLPEWQKEELSLRYKDCQKGSLELYDWQSVHEELRGKHKSNRHFHSTVADGFDRDIAGESVAGKPEG